MKASTLFFTVFILSSCQSMNSNDPDSLSFSIPEGSTLSLNKKLTVPQSDTHAVIQYGKETTDNDRHDYDVNCRLDVREFGLRTIEPEDFSILDISGGNQYL